MRILPLLILFLSPPAVSGQDQEPSLEDWLIERQERTWTVEETAAITVDNPWGNIAVRAHGVPEVYFLANSQRHRDDPRALDLSVVEEPDAFSLTVLFDRKDFNEGEEPAAWAKRRIDITVFVPEAALTEFSTDDGVLEIRGTREPTQAKTSSGDIRLRVHGPVTVQSEHGDVLAQFLRTDWSRPVEVTTLTGDIRIEMPRGGRAEVAIETRGEITSDYSMTVERVEGSRLKRARLAAGEGGKEMHLNSNRGAIQVVELLVPEETDGR